MKRIGNAGLLPTALACVFLVVSAVGKPLPAAGGTETYAEIVVSVQHDAEAATSGFGTSRLPTRRDRAETFLQATGFLLRVLAVALVAVVAIAAFKTGLIQRLFHGKRPSPNETGDDPDASDISFPVAIRQPLPPWPAPIQAGGNISREWSEFVSERLGELDPSKLSQDGETRWALDIVDFLDELSEPDETASEAEVAESKKIGEAVVSVLTALGYARVDSDVWNPALQRAVAVVRKPDAAETKILGKGSTGLARNGKIIRKQEVKIEIKGN